MKQTLFAVPMTCDGCVKDISGALHKLQGITKVEANLQEQLVSIEGTGMFCFVCCVCVAFQHLDSACGRPEKKKKGGGGHLQTLCKVVGVAFLLTIGNPNECSCAVGYRGNHTSNGTRCYPAGI